MAIHRIKSQSPSKSNSSSKDHHRNCHQRSLRWLRKASVRSLFNSPFSMFEPLVNTMEGYCSTFEALCTAAYKERMSADDEDAETPTKTKMAVKMGCANTKALTIGTANALCQCASYDMTDRFNSAIVGGIVSSQGKKDDFGAEGILDAIQFLPAIPTFLSIIRVLQTVCYYVSFLELLATNAHPPTRPAKKNKKKEDLLSDEKVFAVSVKDDKGNYLKDGEERMSYGGQSSHILDYYKSSYLPASLKAASGHNDSGSSERGLNLESISEDEDQEFGVDRLGIFVPDVGPSWIMGPVGLHDASIAADLPQWEENAKSLMP
ncbi:hypothetical protein BGW39_007733 [Mortierella sp. 14UC]|nr:hypothetical protein BGW39_007733 [Mortierella sp. 14UC]